MPLPKIFLSILACAPLAALTGCGGSEDAVDQSDSPVATPQTSAAETSTPTESSVETSRNKSPDNTEVLDLSEFFPEKKAPEPTSASLAGLKFQLRPYTEMDGDKVRAKGTRKEYTNGEIRRHGQHTYYYDDGKKQSSGEYEDDKKVGVWSFWHPNGQKSKEGKYVDGFAEGKWTLWYENGKVRSEGNYEHSRQVGEWTIYDASGKKSTRDFSAKQG
jgi:hypothetical protein